VKVRCVKLVDALDQPTGQSPWMTVGRTYHVLSVVLDKHSRWLLRLVSDENRDVGLFRLEQFEVLTTRIPASWVLEWSNAGTFELSPSAWLAPGFWERYFEHDKTAHDEFERESHKIIQSDP
jgi:hypothetical protein